MGRALQTLLKCNLPSKDDDLPRPMVYLDETKIADSQPLDRLPSATAI